MHTIAFRSPVLECIVCNPLFSVKVKVKTYAGVELYSSWFDIQFKDPVINQIYVTDGSTTISRHVHIAGQNFGQRGIVVTHSENGEEEELPFISVDGNIPSSGSYVISYDHSEVHVEYFGVAGTVSVKRAGVSSALVNFQQLSPVILRAATKNDNSLYMKSDEIFTTGEQIYYDKEGFGHLPLECRVLGQENLPSCQFFDIVYNDEASDTTMQNIAATPVIFSTTGYSDLTGVGHLIFECKNCGAGFDESGNIDLQVFVGPTNMKNELKKICRIVTPTIFHSATQSLQVKCKMPPGENNTVPVQLKWGKYLSPPYAVAYRFPSIRQLLLYQSDEYDETSMLPGHVDDGETNISKRVKASHGISHEDIATCFDDVVYVDECACKFTEFTCIPLPHCIWDFLQRKHLVVQYLLQIH